MLWLGFWPFVPPKLAPSSTSACWVDASLRFFELSLKNSGKSGPRGVILIYLRSCHVAQLNKFPNFSLILKKPNYFYNHFSLACNFGVRRPIVNFKTKIYIYIQCCFILYKSIKCLGWLFHGENRVWKSSSEFAIILQMYSLDQLESSLCVQWSCSRAVNPHSAVWFEVMINLFLWYCSQLQVYSSHALFKPFSDEVSWCVHLN